MKVQVYDFNKNGRTHKSLGINEVVDDAVLNQVDTISMISSGNYIRTLIGEIRQRGLENRVKVVNLGNGNRGIEGCNEVEIEKNRVLRDSEEREQYVGKRVLDAGKVKDYTDFTPRAYELKAEEILASNPDYVSLGVGSGKLFLALKKVIQEKGLSTKLVGILPKFENGVFNQWNLYEKDGKLFFKEFDPKSPADKLVCPYTAYGPKIVDSENQGHILVEAETRDFKRANKRARKQGLEAEVSGSAGFVILDPKIRSQYGISENSSVVIVNTGRGYEWETQMKRESRRRLLSRGLISAAAAALIGISSWMYSITPSKDEMKYADLNGDGVVSAEEMVNCHQIVGTYDFNHDKDAQRKYNEIRKAPWIDRKTLAEMKHEREILEKEVLARYQGNLNEIAKRLPNGAKFETFDDLSWNQLKYLNEVKQFETLENPELLRGRLFKQREINKRGKDVPVWDVM